MNGSSAKHWEQLCHTLDELTPDGQFATPSDMIFSILEGVYDDYLKNSFDNADIEQLSEYAATFTDGELTSSSSSSTDHRSPITDHDKVTLSSIHQAKGLEWKAVFDSLAPHGSLTPSGHVAFAPVQSAYKPSALFSSGSSKAGFRMGEFWMPTTRTCSKKNAACSTSH